MIVKRIAARLFAYQEKWQKRGNIHLTIWLLFLSVTLTSLIVLTVEPAHAQSLTATQQAKVHQSASYASPTMPKDTCDQQCQEELANELNGTQNNNGKVENPLGDDPLMFFTDPKLTVGQASIITLWRGGVTIVDAFVVVLFALSGIRIMVSGSIFRYADVVETVPKILVSLIAAHISLALIGVILALNNTLCGAFLSLAQNVSMGHLAAGEVTFNSIFTDFFKSVLGGAGAVGGMLAIAGAALSLLPGVGGVIGGILGKVGKGASVGIGVTFAIALLSQLPRILLQLVGLAMTVMLFGQLIVRILLLDFYIIISAPCIAAKGLPGRSGDPVTNFWLKGIITTAMAQSMQVVGVIVAQILFDGIFHLLDGKLPGFGTGKNVVMNGVNLVQLVVYIAMLWFIIRLPTLFSLNPSTQMIAAGGQVAGGAVTSVAGAIGGGVGNAVSMGGGALVAQVARRSGT